MMKYDPLLHIVLYEPDIPPNTGNVGRTCVAIGAKLWLVEPLGFSLDEKQLRRAGLEGQVLAQFVVDSTGRALLDSYTALHSDHPQFTSAVKTALARLRYLPAEVGGRRVPQLVQQTFQFTLNRE